MKTWSMLKRLHEARRKFGAGLLGPAIVGASWWVALSAPAQAGSGRYNEPVYDSGAKAYFELVNIGEIETPLTWTDAAYLANQRVLRGVKGRLAVVHDPGLHQFLMTTFRADQPAWIGLSYYCKLRQLRWTTGEMQKPGTFQPWASQWDQSAGAGCLFGRGEGDFMPVIYTPIYQGFRWAAKGASKRYRMFFVEYPTGRP